MSITDLTTAAPATVAGPKAYTVGMVDDVPMGEGRTFVVAGTQVAIFRLRDGSLHATQAACPHAGGPLADGLVDRRLVVCPLHQHTFDLGTGCSTTGQPPLTVYPVRVDADDQLVLEI
jgi:nitrite reductase (NADH) small subunit